MHTPSTTLPYLEQLQPLFGRHDLSQVKAHVGAEATASAQAVNAQAYATGNHVVFAGSPDLHTAAHEAAHVIQQRAGIQVAGGVGLEGDEYERHADAVADRVISGQSAEDLLEPYSGAQREELSTVPAEQHLSEADGGTIQMVRVKSRSEATSHGWEGNKKRINYGGLDVEVDRTEALSIYQNGTPGISGKVYRAIHIPTLDMYKKEAQGQRSFN